MIRENVNRLTVLILMLFVLALAGCGGKEAVSPEDFEQQAFDDLRAEMADVIVDPERRAIMSGLADVLQRDFAELRIAVTVRRTELRKLNADYDATRESNLANTSKNTTLVSEPAAKELRRLISR